MINYLLKECLFRTGAGIGLREAFILATLDFMTAVNSTWSSPSPIAFWNRPATIKLKANIVNCLTLPPKSKKKGEREKGKIIKLKLSY